MKKASRFLSLIRRFRAAAVLTSAAVLAAASGCAKDILVEEVLQMPEHAVIRTAYNIRYENPQNISTLNLQKGAIIPFGTPVEIVRATEKEIFFRTLPDRKDFRIDFETRYRMQPVADYLRRLFTVKTRDELTIGMRPVVCEKILRGIVEPGMTRAEVLLAYGPPCAFLTPDETLDTWLYWTDMLVGRRLVFQNDRIVEIIQL